MYFWGLLRKPPPGCLPATRPSAAACPPPTAHLNFLALRHGDPPLKQSSLVQNSLGIHWLTTASSNKIQLPKGFCPGCILLAVVYTRVPQNHQQGSELLELLLAQTTPPRHVVPVIGGNRLDGFPPLVLENPIPMIPMTLCFVQQPGLLAWKAVQPDGRGIRFEKSIPACPPTYLTGFACIPTCLHT